jgi:hypothetical protein
MTVIHKPITHVIYRHDHLDHVVAVTDSPTATRIAHTDAARLFALHNDSGRPMPHKIVDRAMDFHTYVGGHVYRTGTRAQVKQSRDFFLDLWSTTGKKMSEISFNDIDAALAEPANVWAAQKVWIDKIAQSVTSELVNRWGTQLAAVDTSPWTRSAQRSFPSSPTRRPTS